MKLKEIDADMMRSLFHYENGMLFNKVSRGTRSIKGSRAGSVKRDGYVRIIINRSSYSEHRIIYAMHHGRVSDNIDIDHINGDRADNRIENLRIATKSQNMMNRRSAHKNNELGVQGVRVMCGQRKKKYRAQISVGGKHISVGYFLTAEEASVAYQAARKEYFGEFA